MIYMFYYLFWTWSWLFKETLALFVLVSGYVC